MSLLNELLSTVGGLDEEAVEYLQQLLSDWQILADEVLLVDRLGCVWPHLTDAQVGGRVIGQLVRHEQQEVGKRQVGQDLPVRQQLLQVLDGFFVQPANGGQQLVQQRHATILPRPRLSSPAWSWRGA